MKINKTKPIDNPLYLHIGYHKTATTFLQDEIFQKSDSIIFLGQPFFNRELNDFFKEIKDIHDLFFNSNDLKHKFKEILCDIYYSDNEIRKKINSGAPILISLESLHSGIDWWGREIVTMANRIKSIFSDAKIIIGFREQTKLIESHYKEYLIHGGKISWKNFIYNSHYFKYYFYPKLNYNLVASLYYELFDYSNVFIYLHEEIKENSDNVVIDLCKFLSTKNLYFSNQITYEGINKSQAEFIRRFINKFMVIDSNDEIYKRNGLFKNYKASSLRRYLVAKIRARRFYFRKTTYLTIQDKEYLNSIFSNSNKELEKIIKKPIKKYGYYK